jgi:hypothetical protein
VTPQQRDEYERPHEIELLFDGQRPEVRERTERAEALRDAEPVCGVRQGREHAELDVGRGSEHPGARDHEHDDNQREVRRKQPRNAPAIEVADVQCVGAPVFLNDEGRDEQPAQDEEQIDAEPAAAEAADAEVVQHHGHDGHGAQAVERRLVPESDARRLRFDRTGHCRLPRAFPPEITRSSYSLNSSGGTGRPA